MSLRIIVRDTNCHVCELPKGANQYILQPCSHQICTRCYEDWTERKNCKICKLDVERILPPLQPLHYCKASAYKTEQKQE